MLLRTVPLVQPVTSRMWFASRGARAVSTAAIKELRAATGAPMMECKSALTESGGDLDAAVDWLRKKGVAQASKKAGRTAGEGLVGVAVAQDGLSAVMVEMNSETDFVARNDVFQDLVARVSNVALSVLPPVADGDATDHLQALLGAPMAAAEGAREVSVEEAVVECVAKVRENIVLRRAAVVTVPPGGLIASYVHNKVTPTAGTLGVLLGVTASPGLGNATPEQQESLHALTHTMALHTAAAAPRYLSRDQVPQADLDRERAVLAEAALASGKKPDVVEKMVEGRLRKFYQEHVLLEQECMLGEDSRALSAMLRDAAGPSGQTDLALTSFARFKCGEAALGSGDAGDASA